VFRAVLRDEFVVRGHLGYGARYGFAAQFIVRDVIDQRVLTRGRKAAECR
jgi:hypothetical protein